MKTNTSTLEDQYGINIPYYKADLYELTKLTKPIMITFLVLLFGMHEKAT